MANKVNDINIYDGEIAYSNFSGRPTQFNPNGGVRTVTFVIPPDIADSLIADGWHIREQIFDDGTSRFLLEAKITFKTRTGQIRDPKIFIIRNDGVIHITEDTVSTLDRMEIVNAEAVIGPFYWDWGGKSGITAYVNSLYITVKENPIDEKYRMMINNMNDSFLPTDSSDLPFPLDT